MKTYNLTYQSGLGDFLDEQSIDWHWVHESEIYFNLENDTALFNLGNEFQAWKNKHNL